MNRSLCFGLAFLVAVLMPAVVAMAFHPTTSSCNSCHLPHGADNDSAGASQVPLWSGAQTGLSGWENYPKGETLESTPGDPVGVALLCLGCHDGAVETSHDLLDGTADLSGTHPISFLYTSQLAIDDGELVDPTTAGSSNLNITNPGSIQEELLEGDMLTCSSCHDVHKQGLHKIEMTIGGNDVTFGKSEGIKHFQNISGITMKKNYGAAGTVPGDFSLNYGPLCLTCHIK